MTNGMMEVCRSSYCAFIEGMQGLCFKKKRTRKIKELFILYLETNRW